MNEITLKITIDTSDLDEAIVKAKILNEELEKAKSLRNEMAESVYLNEDTFAIKGSLMVTEELICSESSSISDEVISRIVTEILDALRRDSIRTTIL